MALQQFVITYLLWFLEYVIINKSLLGLVLKSGQYRDMLDKKVKKHNEQFGNRFVKETKKGSKSRK